MNKQYKKGVQKSNLMKKSTQNEYDQERRSNRQKAQLYRLKNKDKRERDGILDCPMNSADYGLYK